MPTNYCVNTKSLNRVAMHPAAQKLVEALNLKPHPEGGFFRETYRDKNGASTAIYYLLADGDISRLHRIKSDEVWHHYAGDLLTVAQLGAGGSYKETILGGGLPQHVVPAGDWFGAYLPKGGFALVGCTVAPAFLFADLEFGDRSTLLKSHPAAKAIIAKLLP